ncbi:glycosyltransferase [Candidatus Phyllobacterium onerii]|uniref:glycosyltransferase n=1 Tax=Candidatus Phyllobacterium onerii TaxID=3020828 RepID=UPI00232EAF9D|nr:glycosyltransferase [Phyllobacterium sp. IY22]
MNDKPIISVLIPSYNHAEFIETTVNSILAQTHREIQVVIVDDASVDHSADVIRSINDERIVSRFLATNVGACQAMNIGLSMCEGDFIAVCNSDDVWVPDKLERQLEIFASGTKLGAVFSDVEWIDDSSRSLSEADLLTFEPIFKQPNRSRFTWIKDLTEHGNCLCHPSVLIRREVYENVGTYNNFYRQLPDLDMWLRVLQHYDILVMPEKLVGFRVHENNTSRPSLTTSNRSINEHRLILVNLFKCITAENFYSAFGFTNVASLQDDKALKFEIATYLLDYRGGSLEKMLNQLGSEILLEMPQDEVIQRGISAHDFHRNVGRNTPWIQHEPIAPERLVESEASMELETMREPPITEIKTVDLIKTVINRLRSRLLRV